MTASQGMFFNRIHVTATKDFSQMPLKPYVWNPPHYMVVRTFLGFNEMTPDMKLLRTKLLDFYKPDKNNNLFLQLSLFLETTACDFFDKDPNKEAYLDVMADLSALMVSPLWNKVVKLPLHLRQNAIVTPNCK